MEIVGPLDKETGAGSGAPLEMMIQLIVSIFIQVHILINLYRS